MGFSPCLSWIRSKYEFFSKLFSRAADLSRKSGFSRRGTVLLSLPGMRRNRDGSPASQPSVPLQDFDGCGGK